MRNTSLLLIAGICAIAACTSCSKDDGPAPLPVTQITGDYGTGNQKTLSLNYSGKPMSGKTVKVSPDGDGKAKLTIKGAPLMTQKAGFPEIVMPGAIAGETETVLDITLVNVDGIAYSFEGEDKTAARTIRYKGTIDEKALQLDLDVTVENALSGKKLDLCPWIPGETEADAPKSQPIYINWKSTGTISVSKIGFPPAMPAQSILTLAFGLQIGENPTPQAMLVSVFKSVTFQSDGNIVAEFKHKPTDTEWSKNEINVAQFYMKGENQVFVVLNLPAILEAIGSLPIAKADKDAPSLNVSVILPGLMKMVPSLTTGIPLTLKAVEGKDILCLDTDTCKSLLQDILIPFLEDPTNQAILAEKIKAAGGMASMIDISVLTPSLKADVEIATEIEIGINMTK